MAEVSRHEPGMFSWVDLTTTEAEGARAFYTGVFGWESVDNPVDEDSFYTVFMKGGKNVAGMFQMTPEMQEQGAVTCWNAYVTVESADEIAAKATAQGGTLIVAPMDVFSFGRMCMLLDPQQAAFAMWQPKEHIGAELMGDPGTFVWAELYTHDTEAAARFYSAVFGWEAEATTGAEGIPYTAFRVGGAPAGGMLQIQPEWGEVPPNWAAYFAVESLGSALEQVGALGGKVVGPSMSIPEIGTFAPVLDPQNGFFMLIELAQTE